MSRRAATATVSAKLKPKQNSSNAKAAITGDMPHLPATVSLPALLDSGSIPDGTFRQLLYDISVAAVHLESARQYLAERLGVTSPQYNIVMVVAHSAGANGISVSDVASRLNVSGAFVTTEVKKLVKANLILKESNPEDGRGVLLKLSPQGYERVHAIESDQIMVNDRLFGLLSREDFLNLSRIVGSLIGTFGQTAAVLRAMSLSTTSEVKLTPKAASPRKKAAK